MRHRERYRKTGQPQQTATGATAGYAPTIRITIHVHPTRHHRSTTLELLQHPARRRPVLRRLRRAVDLSAVPQDGRRAGHELGKASAIPAGLGWDSLLRLDGDELETHYRHILASLGNGTGLIPVIFRKAQNKIQDPAKLRRLIDLIDNEQWIGLDMDVKGAIYEGLLEKNAQDMKAGAGQYFTPRPLITAMVDVMRPRPGQTICDPAGGTGGFLLAAHDYIAGHHARWTASNGITCGTGRCTAGRSWTAPPGCA